MWGRSGYITTLFLGRLRHSKQLTNTKMYILSLVTLFESAEGEKKVSGRSGYRTSDLWLLNQTLSMMICAKLQYLLNALFLRAKSDLRIQAKSLHVPCSRILYYADIYLLCASEAQRRPGLLSPGIPPASEFVIPQTVLQSMQNFIIV